MASVKKHLPLLELLQKSKPKLRKSILTTCEIDFVRTLINCIYNTLNGNIKISDSEKKKLNKFKTILRKVLLTKGGLNKKREIIVQNGGGFLPCLLSPIVTAGIAQFAPEKLKK